MQPVIIEFGQFLENCTFKHYFPAGRKVSKTLRVPRNFLKAAVVIEAIRVENPCFSSYV